MTFSCILCGSSSAQELFTTQSVQINGHLESFPLVQCSRCTLTTLWPQPPDETLHAVYASDYYTPHAHIPLGTSFDILFRVWRHRRVTLLKRLKPGGKFLDVGCGAGSLVGDLLANGYDAYGMDTAPAAATAIPQHLLPRIMLRPLEECGYEEGSFDLVMLSDVLEHVRMPHLTLRSIARLLKKDGVLVISVPNWDSMEARLFGRRHWRNIDAPRHLWHFTNASLSALLQHEGFTNITPFDMGIVKLLEAPLILIHGWRSVLDEHVRIPILRSLLFLTLAPLWLAATPILRLAVWNIPHQLRVAARTS